MTPELERMMKLAKAGHRAEVEAWARPRAERGDADGQYLLGFLVYAGGRVDFATACEWLHRAAAQDHAEAIYELSRIDDNESRAHSRKPINDTMRARLRRAADLGSARAQHDLGVLLATGHGGFEKNDVEAREQQRRAAHSGHLLAQVSYGQMCLRGEGGPIDVEEGLLWLERAASTDISSDPLARFAVSQAAQLLQFVYTRGVPGVTPAPDKAAAASARLAAADGVRQRERKADDSAVGHDAEGRAVRRPFAFADPGEAQRVLVDHMRMLRLRGRAALLADIDRDVVTRLRGPSGIEYDASVRVFWADQPNGELTVAGSIQDAGWHTYTMISEFFSVAPDGTIGE